MADQVSSYNEAHIQSLIPDDFAFRLNLREVANLKSRYATSSSTLGKSRSRSHGGGRTLPMAFTEHGAVMAANILNSPRAVQMSVFVVRAFVRMRNFLGETQDLARRLNALEKEHNDRQDVHEAAIVSILQRLLDVIDPPLPAKMPVRKCMHRVHWERKIRRLQSREEMNPPSELI